MDETGEPVPKGQIGELWMRGPYITPGYFKSSEEAQSASTNGWLRTGDAAYADADGYIFIRDRIKDLIITGGENVSPLEVESAIAGCPGIAEVAVVGVPSEKWGEEIKAVVVRSRESSITAQDVISWSRKSIAGYKVPKSVDFIDAIPRNSAGKMLKRELRAKYWLGENRTI